MRSFLQAPHSTERCKGKHFLPNYQILDKKFGRFIKRHYLRTMFVSIDNPPMAKMEQLYHDFHHRLFIYAMTLLNEEDKAKDVVADVFCAVWEDWHRTASNTAGYTTPNATYLFLLTRNKCIDLLRHEKAKRNYASLLEKATPPHFRRRHFAI